MTIGALEATTLLACMAAAFILSKRKRTANQQHLRGTQMNLVELPTEPTEGHPYLWGGRFISFSAACKHSRRWVHRLRKDRAHLPLDEGDHARDCRTGKGRRQGARL